MNKIRELIRMKRITYKLFLITSIILFSFALLIYTLLYFFLPSFYKEYKIKQLQFGIDEIIAQSPHLTLEEAKPLLTKYVINNNAFLMIKNNQGQTLYSPNIPSINNSSVTISGEVIASSSGALSITNEVSANSYSINKPIRFQGVTLNLIVMATFQPIDEASKVLILFIPYISIMVIIIGLGSAYLYSRLITKPILYINQGAQKMANLDFSKKIEVRSQDELGELSKNLNDLACNLQQNMEALEKANQQLKNDIEKEREIEKKRREFFAIVSHELKTPLTTLKGHIEGMIYQIGPYKDRDMYLQKNFQTVEDMEKLIREILSISKLEQHTFKPHLEDINLTELLSTITKKLDYIASQKSVQIIEKMVPDIYVYTDRNLLEKAFTNIIHNGILYSPSGEKVYVRLHQSTKHSNIQIQIENTGTHIKEEEIQQIFKPFYRIEKSRNRNTGGSGLGLYLVKQVFESLSITYNVKNIEQGVRFNVSIPVFHHTT